MFVDVLRRDRHHDRVAREGIGVVHSRLVSRRRRLDATVPGRNGTIGVGRTDGAGWREICVQPSGLFGCHGKRWCGDDQQRRDDPPRARGI